MSGINIGNLQTDEDVQIGEINIPLITPKRGVDYWTPQDKQEVVTEAIDAVNAVVMPQEQTRQNNEVTRQNNETTRQSNETTRQENEATRQENEATRIDNETARETRFAEYEAIIDGVEDDLEEMQGDLSDIQVEQTTQNTNISANASAIETLQANKMDKSDIPSIDNLTNYYKKSETYNKTEIDGKVSSVYKYKGTVATYQDLPSTDLTIGDVYNVEEDGSNYAWTGNSWDKLGGDIDLSEYYTKTQTDSLLNAKANSSDVYNKTETYNKTEVNTLLEGKVDKEQGKGLSSNDFTDNYKNQIEANQTAIAGIKNGTTINDFGAVETALENKEDKSNKVTELTDQSTDVEYPSAKCVYDELEVKQSEIDTLQQDVEDLRGACLSVEGTGTDIRLNNTAQARLLKNELGGRTEQDQLSGKNLVNYAEATTTSVSSVTLGEFTNYEVGKTYTFSAKLDLGNTEKSGRIRMKIEYNDETPTSYVGSYVAGTGVKTSVATVTITDNIESIALQYQPNQTGIKYYDFQLEEGGEATSYEPYCGGIPSPNPDYPQAIKNVTGNANVKIQNKNLFDKDNANILNGYIDNANKIISYNTNTTIFIPIQDNIDVTIKKFKGTTPITCATSVDIPSINSIVDHKVASNDTLLTYHIGNNAKYLVVFCQGTADLNAGYTVADILENLQIEEGTTATSYVPHQEQNYPFTFAEGQILGNNEELKDNGKDDIWGEYIFTGNENWADYQGTQTGDFYKFYTAGVKLGRANTMEARADAFCTHFINNNFYGNNNGIGLTQNATYISINKTIASTPEELKTWFATQYANGKPVKVQFIKSNPTIIPYNSTQQAQYNNIKANASSYDDITIISSESDELGFDIKAIAVADANKVIESQNNEIDTIKSRLDLLEG